MLRPSDVRTVSKLTGEQDEELIAVLLDDAESFVLAYTMRTKIIQPLEKPVRDLAVIALNRMGTEGENSRSEGGETYNFNDAPKQIFDTLNRYRICRVGGKVYEKGNWQVFPTFIRGVDFLGYRTFYKYTLLRKTTCIDMTKKLTALRVKVESGNMMNYSEWCSLNSYKGWLISCDSFRLYQKYIEPLLPYADDYYKYNIKPKSKKGQKAA